MEFLKYSGAVFTTWFTGFFPYFEIYVAIPVGFAAGLNWFDAFLWASFGNWMAVPFIDLCYNLLQKFAFMRKFIDKSLSGKWQKRIEQHGAWFILFFTPWAGVWTVGIIAKAIKYNRAKLWLYTAISIGVTGFIIALVIEIGL